MYVEITLVFGGIAVMVKVCDEMGKIFNLSSITMHFSHDARDRMNLRGDGV